jgi:endoglucanase
MRPLSRLRAGFLLLICSREANAVDETPEVSGFPLVELCAGTKSTQCEIEFSSHDERLWANGQEFRIKGVNWFGSEERHGVPYGLNEHPIDYYMDFLKANGFNSLRLLFNHESVIADAQVQPSGIQKAQHLYGLSYLEMFAAIAERAASRGILVAMACHRLRPDAWPGNGLWYDEYYLNEESVMRSWELVAEALCKQWNVFAADLQNGAR